MDYDFGTIYLDNIWIELNIQDKYLFKIILMDSKKATTNK